LSGIFFAIYYLHSTPLISYRGNFKIFSFLVTFYHSFYVLVIGEAILQLEFLWQQFNRQSQSSNQRSVSNLPFKWEEDLLYWNMG